MKRITHVALAVLALAATAARAEDMEKPRFHHTHINAVDPMKSIEYYKKMFSAVAVKYHGKADAILADRSFILFNKVEKAAPWKLESGIYHIGWGGVDGPSEFEWRSKKGMQWQTGLSTLGTNYYMYAFGPDKEVVEVWTGFQHERFGHVHLFSDDVGAATEWYVKNLGVAGPARMTPKPPKAPDGFKADPKNPTDIFRFLWTSQVTTADEVAINIFAKPSKDTVNWWADEPVGDLQQSDGRAIDHIAFSYRKIQPVYDRMKANGVKIVDDIKLRPEFGFKSFFVRGPDKVLVEIVEEKPLPEGLWE